MAKVKSRARRRFGYVRETRSGRWQASYLDPRTRERVAAETTFKTWTEADQWLVDVEGRLNRGDLPDLRLGRLTFENWAEQWLATVQVRVSTAEKYAGIIRTHLKPTFGAVRMNAITRTD